MIFSNLVRTRQVPHRQAHALWAPCRQEIQSLTHRDLADVGTDRGDMLRHAYLDIYGK